MPEYNPQTQTIESIERVEQEIKILIRKRDEEPDPTVKRLLDEELANRETELKQLRVRLGA